MSGLRKVELLKRIRSALEKSGAVLAVESNPSQIPMECIVRFPGDSGRRFRMYYWNVSQGGQARSRDEYRIQTKLQQSARALEFGRATTVLLGYYHAALDQTTHERLAAPPEDMEVFVAWDPVAHLRVGASSSCQVPFQLMYAAYLDGRASVDRRVARGIERVRAFRSEQLAAFLREEAEGVGAVRD